jgi:hypothetical protein
LTVPQKTALLRDPVTLSKLHFEVWTSALAHAAWVQASVVNRTTARAQAPAVIESHPAVRRTQQTTGAGWMPLAHAKGAEGFGKLLRAMRRVGSGAR